MKTDTKRFLLADVIILVVILIIAMTVRSYGINNPLADFHSWRQADTAAVGRNFARDGFDLMHPRFDDVSSIQSGIENPKGYRFVEFPIYSAMFAALYKFLPFFSLEFYGRLVTALFSLAIIAIIYYLSLRESGRVSAVVAASVYAVFPFFVFFSRVILPDPTATAFAFISIWLMYLFTERKGNHWGYYILSLLAFTVAILIKPPVIFYAGALLFLFVRKYDLGVIKKWQFYAFFILAGIPLALWRYYILQFPEGIPPSDWLITEVNTYEGLKVIFFRPAFFRWIFSERISTAIFGGYATFLFLLGTIKKNKSYFLHVILFCAMAYLFTFQGGNVQHAYYQTVLLPALAIMVGLGVEFLTDNQTMFNSPVILYGVIATVFAFSLYFSVYTVREYYHYPPELAQIGRVINTLTKPEDRVVTDRLGDTTLLYLADRKGAPAIYRDPAELKNLGYTHLATLNADLIKKLKDEGKYPVLFENDKFALFKL